jgi:hypothetical protein
MVPPPTIINEGALRNQEPSPPTKMETMTNPNDTRIPTSVAISNRSSFVFDLFDYTYRHPAAT